MLVFSHCPDETDDEETDECRGCPSFSLGGEYCGAVWLRPDGSTATHLEVARQLDPGLAAVVEKFNPSLRKIGSMTNPTTPRMLDPDEAQLLTLVGEAEAAQVAFQTDGNISRLLAAREAILAHYRSAKTRPGPQQVYTADDGSQWVEDPTGTHWWWSENPGQGIYGFQPVRRTDKADHPGVMRFYRQV